MRRSEAALLKSRLKAIRRAASGALYASRNRKIWALEDRTAGRKPPPPGELNSYVKGYVEYALKNTLAECERALLDLKLTRGRNRD